MVVISKLRHILSLIVSLSVLWLIVTILLKLSLEQNDGHLVYALDDPYIHMAIAKNFAKYGNWGVTKYEFSSSSSSLLWTLLLSFLFFIFGIDDRIPFILNVIFATFTIILIYMKLKDKASNLFTIFILLAIIIFTPLPPPYIYWYGTHTTYTYYCFFLIYGYSVISRGKE